MLTAVAGDESERRKMREGNRHHENRMASSSILIDAGRRSAAVQTVVYFSPLHPILSNLFADLHSRLHPHLVSLVSCHVLERRATGVDILSLVTLFSFYRLLTKIIVSSPFTQKEREMRR